MLIAARTFYFTDSLRLKSNRHIQDTDQVVSKIGTGSQIHLHKEKSLQQNEADTSIHLSRDEEDCSSTSNASPGVMFLKMLSDSIL